MLPTHAARRPGLGVVLIAGSGRPVPKLEEGVGLGSSLTLLPCVPRPHGAARLLTDCSHLTLISLSSATIYNPLSHSHSPSVIIHGFTEHFSTLPCSCSASCFSHALPWLVHRLPFIPYSLDFVGRASTAHHRITQTALLLWIFVGCAFPRTTGLFYFRVFTINSVCFHSGLLLCVSQNRITDR